MPETTARYTIISADTHAGGSHAQYREYLDESFREEFDAWRGKYKNPFKDLRDTSDRVRNWDSERRWSDMQRDGVVAEVIFPNTIPPFFPSFVLFAPPPHNGEEYRLRHAGIQAHNRWLADFVAECPERRAGIGQIFVNDLDDTLEDARWIKEHGLRGGVLLPNFAPDVTWLPPYFDRSYDRLWAALEDLDLVVNIHGGTGSPSYGDPFGAGGLIQLAETQFFSQRPLVHLLLGGALERFPRLKVAITELGCAWVPGLLRQLDGIATMLRSGSTGELRFTEGTIPPLLPSEYFARNCWIGASQPRVADAEAGRTLAPGRFMWGNDYPHDEGTFPFTRETLRAVFEDYDETELSGLLGGNAAGLYGFDLAKLAPCAQQHGPTVAEIAEPLVEMPDRPNQALRLARTPR
jgi:predicted TIM-barrel fold metal-dependent hydrolase